MPRGLFVYTHACVDSSLFSGVVAPGRGGCLRPVSGLPGRAPPMNDELAFSCIGNAGGEEEEKEKQEENHTASHRGFGKNSLQNSSPKSIFQGGLNYSQLLFSYCDGFGLNYVQLRSSYG